LISAIARSLERSSALHQRIDRKLQREQQILRLEHAYTAFANCEYRKIS
jgi:hypothetical protein